MRRLVLAAAVCATLTVGGCAGVQTDGSDPPGGAGTAPAPTSAPPSAAAPTPLSITPQLPTAATTPDCRSAGSLRLETVSGTLSCDEMRFAVDAYDFDGEKVQEVDGFTCATGTADTRPVVLTCTRGSDEFTASEVQPS